MLRGQENELITKYQFDRANRNREITALLAERSVDFIKHAISSGNTMEEARMRFALGFAGVYNEITTAIISRFKAQQDALVAEFEGKVKVILSKLQVNDINAKLELAYNDQIIKQWQIQNDQLIQRVKSNIEQNYKEAEVQVKAAASLGDLYKGLSASAASQITGLVGSTEYTDLTP
jgi:DNA replication protein DnaD